MGLTQSDTSIRNAANTAENAGFGISEYMSLCTDPIPGNLETGPKRVLWVSLKELFSPRFIKVDVALFFQKRLYWKN